MKLIDVIRNHKNEINDNKLVLPTEIVKQELGVTTFPALIDVIEESMDMRIHGVSYASNSFTVKNMIQSVSANDEFTIIIVAPNFEKLKGVSGND